MTRGWNGYLVRALRELASLTAECRVTAGTTDPAEIEKNDTRIADSRSTCK